MGSLVFLGRLELSNEDRRRAARWLGRAVRLGDDEAMYLLGTIYLLEDWPTAGRKLLENAADLRNSDAAELLVMLDGGSQGEPSP